MIIKRGQSNFSNVFISASGEEKSYFCVISIRQLNFDCRTYCGLSRRMQGDPSRKHSRNARVISAEELGRMPKNNYNTIQTLLTLPKEGFSVTII